MNGLDITQITLPGLAFFGAGWAAAIKYVAVPIKEQLAKAEAKLTRLEEDSARELAELRKAVRG